MNQTKARLPGQPWTLKEARAMLGMTEPTLRKYIRLGKIKVILIGESQRVPDEEMTRICRDGMCSTESQPTDLSQTGGG